MASSGRNRARRLVAGVLVAIAAVLLPLGILAGWTGSTLYDSDTFAKRAGNLLESQVGSLGNSFAAATRHLAALHVWQIEGWVHAAWLVGILGGLAAGAAAIAVAPDRRRTVAHLGWMLVVDGVVISGAVVALQWYAGHPIADNDLAAAVRDGVGRWTGDLRSIGLWIAGYGHRGGSGGFPAEAARGAGYDCLVLPPA